VFLTITQCPPSNQKSVQNIIFEPSPTSLTKFSSNHLSSTKPSPPRTLHTWCHHTKTPLPLPSLDLEIIHTLLPTPYTINCHDPIPSSNTTSIKWNIKLPQSPHTQTFILIIEPNCIPIKPRDFPNVLTT